MKSYKTLFLSIGLLLPGMAQAGILENAGKAFLRAGKNFKDEAKNALGIKEAAGEQAGRLAQASSFVSDNARKAYNGLTKENAVNALKATPGLAKDAFQYLPNKAADLVPTKYHASEIAKYGVYGAQAAVAGYAGYKAFKWATTSKIEATRQRVVAILEGNAPFNTDNANNVRVLVESAMPTTGSYITGVLECAGLVEVDRKGFRDKKITKEGLEQVIKAQVEAINAIFEKAKIEKPVEAPKFKVYKRPGRFSRMATKLNNNRKKTAAAIVATAGLGAAVYMKPEQAKKLASSALGGLGTAASFTNDWTLKPLLNGAKASGSWMNNNRKKSAGALTTALGSVAAGLGYNKYVTKKAEDNK